MGRSLMRRCAAVVVLCCAAAVLVGIVASAAVVAIGVVAIGTAGLALAVVASTFRGKKPTSGIGPRKGGVNDWPSQIRERPARPQPIRQRSGDKPTAGGI